MLLLRPGDKVASIVSNPPNLSHINPESSGREHPCASQLSGTGRPLAIMDSKFTPCPWHLQQAQ